MNEEKENVTNLAKALVKMVVEIDKRNRELTKLVCYLRREFDYAVKQKNGIIEEFDFENKNMKKAFDIMMQVEHDREMAKRARAEAKAEKENATAEEGEEVMD